MTPFRNRWSPMDNVRLLLLIALCFVLLLIWQAWEEDYVRVDTAPVPAATRTDGTAIPTAPAVPGAPAVAGSPAAPGAPPVVVRTDVLAVTLDPVGGSIQRLELLDYPVSVDKPDQPFVLIDDAPGIAAESRGGLLSNRAAPDASAVYEVDSRLVRLEEGAERVELVMRWRGEGIEVDKIYTFHRGSYVVDLRYEVRNTGSAPWEGRLYGELLRKAGPGMAMFGVYTYTGAAISSPEEHYQKVSFDDMESEPLGTSITGGWAALLQHYFVDVMVPPPEESYYYYSKVLSDERYLIGVSGPLQSVPAGGQDTLGMRLYFGPKLQKDLAALAPHLDLTVDYGVLWMIAKPLYWLLDKLHSFTGNWGVAIILLTLLVKAAFFQLSAASYRSMAKMRKVQPRLLALRERHADDKTRLNQAMMQLYKDEKINPLGGCLPILIQIPVFLALYWVLLESVELRQAPFIFWIKDLSTKDPYYVLPLLMGITMFAQQKLNPTPPDPIQARIMQILPVVFTVFFLMFPAGLVLYWFVNNLLSIAQQWIITRQIEKSSGPAHAG